MIRRSVVIDLLEDCVFSARAATEGGHESLDRIPGAALLGAAAARLYAELAPCEAYAVFHSGRLRFQDGLPYDGHTVGYPVPLCWHHRKTDEPKKDGRLQSAKVFNLLHGSIPSDADGRPAQPKQMRKAYVHADGGYSEPKRELRLKTAIDPRSGRAAEGQLFGYDALLRGQRFAAVVEADENFEPELFARVAAAIEDEVLLGRSRSAEYGLVRLEAADLDWPQAGPADDRHLTLWLLSDFAPADAAGHPLLTPTPESLDLPVRSRIVWDKTFVRTRRYSPWNAARHGFDRERLVLTAGGVITAELPAPPDACLLERLQEGIGLHREAGLGRVWVNPAPLTLLNPRFSEPAAAEPNRAEAAKPTHPLVEWLESHQTGWKAKAEEEALRIAEGYSKVLRAARRLAGVPPDATDFGPSKSQWGRILETARRTGGRQRLSQALFEDESAVVKPAMPGWNVEVCTHDGQWLKLAEWFKQTLDAQKQAEHGYAHLVRRLAHRVREDIEKRRI